MPTNKGKVNKVNRPSGTFAVVLRWMNCSFTAALAVSRIRGIIKRRVILCAAARRFPTGRASAALHPVRVTFNIASRFAFGNSPLGSRSYAMPLTLFLLSRSLLLSPKYDTIV